MEQSLACLWVWCFNRGPVFRQELPLLPPKATGKWSVTLIGQQGSLQRLFCFGRMTERQESGLNCSKHYYRLLSTGDSIQWSSCNQCQRGFNSHTRSLSQTIVWAKPLLLKCNFSGLCLLVLHSYLSLCHFLMLLFPSHPFCELLTLPLYIPFLLR